MSAVDDYAMTIDGRAEFSPTRLEVVNPASEKVIATVPDCTPEQLDKAVAAARAAYPSWRAVAYAERQRAIKAIGVALKENVDDLMRLLTAEQGKTHADARAEILGAAYWCDGTATLELPVTINEDDGDRRSETHRVPIGVVGGIVPWNFPVMLGIWKIAPALLAGNTLVIKPSPFTPLTMLKIGEIVRDLLPSGVFNVVSGGDQLGPLMSSHPGIDKISFTGSTATGKKVMASAAETLKRITLELGGNDPAIVFPDVDVEALAEDLFWSAFSNTGQICIATKRLYVHEDVYDRLKNALVEVANRVKLGDGSRQGVDLGPVQNKIQFERVKALIEESRREGHRFVVGGDMPDGPGYFIPVTIIDSPPDDSRVVREEAFGPVLPMLKFRDADEVVQRANDTIYGLAGSVWSADVDRAADVASQLEAGTVWINEVQHLTPFATFAGHKKSGVGAENGLDGLLEYTIAKTVTRRHRKVRHDAVS